MTDSGCSSINNDEDDQAWKEAEKRVREGKSLDGVNFSVKGKKRKERVSGNGVHGDDKENNEIEAKSKEKRHKKDTERLKHAHGDRPENKKKRKEKS